MKLTRIAGGLVNGPRISGDGSTIAFAQELNPEQRARGEIMLHRDGATKRITEDFHEDRDVRLNHTGDVLIWTHNNGGDNKPGDQDIMRWENGKIERIGNSPNDEIQARMTPDGSKVVYQNRGEVDNHWGRIEGWNRDTESKEVYTAGINPAMMPVVSADGERVAYFKRPAEIRFINDIWLTDQNGVEKPVRLNKNRKWSLDMSADGNLISWIELDGNGQNLYVRDLAEGTLKKVHTAERLTNADLSDDGRSILWGEFEGRDIKMMYSYDGAPAEEIGADIPGRHYQGNLSADGRALTWLHEAEDGSKSIYKGEILTD